MDTPGAGPLSHGQLSVWRDIERLPEDRWHEANTWTRWPVPDGVDAGRARRALLALGARHPSLHTVYDFTDPTAPLQAVRPADGDAEVTAAAEDPDDVLTALLARPFALHREVGWRAHVATDRGRATDVLLVKHHMTADGWCDAVLRHDFLALLADPGTGPGQPATGPMDLAAWQHSDRRAKARAAAAAHWEDVLASGTTGFPGADPAGAEVLQCTIRSRRARAGAEALAARTGAGLSGVVLAAYTLAVARVTGETRPVAQSMCANRFHPQWRDVVTSMNQWTAARYEVVDDLDEHIGRVHRTSMASYRHGMFDVDTVARLRAAAPAFDATCAYNFLSLDHTPSGRPDDGRPDALRPDEGEPVWEEPFSTIGHGCYLRAADEAGATLALRLRTKGIPKDRTEAIATDVHTLLASAADAPAAR